MKHWRLFGFEAFELLKSATDIIQTFLTTSCMNVGLTLVGPPTPPGIRRHHHGGGGAPLPRRSHGGGHTALTPAPAPTPARASLFVHTTPPRTGAFIPPALVSFPTPPSHTPQPRSPIAVATTTTAAVAVNATPDILGGYNTPGRASIAVSPPQGYIPSPSSRGQGFIPSPSSVGSPMVTTDTDITPVRRGRQNVDDRDPVRKAGFKPTVEDSKERRTKSADARRRSNRNKKVRAVRFAIPPSSLAASLPPRVADDESTLGRVDSVLAAFDREVTQGYATLQHELKEDEDESVDGVTMTAQNLQSRLTILRAEFARTQDPYLQGRIALLVAAAAQLDAELAEAEQGLESIQQDQGTTDASFNMDDLSSMDSLNSDIN